MGFQVLFFIQLCSLSANPLPPEFIFSFLFPCVFVSLRWNFDALRALPVQGVWEGPHTPKHTHTQIYTYLKCPSLSSCVPLFALKDAPRHTHSHPALLAAGIPSGPGCVFAAASFDLLFCAAVLQLSWATAGLEGWRWGCVGGLVLMVLTDPPQGIPHHLSSSCHMFFYFFYFALCYIKTAPKPPKTLFFFFFEQRFNIKIGDMSFIQTGLEWCGDLVQFMHDPLNAVTCAQSNDIHWNMLAWDTTVREKDFVFASNHHDRKKTKIRRRKYKRIEILNMLNHT